MEADEGCPSPIIRISITPAAFDAIAATLALGSVGVEQEGRRERGSDRMGFRGAEADALLVLLAGGPPRTSRSSC